MERKTICGKCKRPFECRVDDIRACQCITIELTSAQRISIMNKFSDCICIDCLEVEKRNFENEQ